MRCFCFRQEIINVKNEKMPGVVQTIPTHKIALTYDSDWVDVP